MLALIALELDMHFDDDLLLAFVRFLDFMDYAIATPPFLELFQQTFEIEAHVQTADGRNAFAAVSLLDTDVDLFALDAACSVGFECSHNENCHWERLLRK